jgi:hypothetical protein
MILETYEIWRRIRKFISRTGRFYTVSEKRLANLHFFVEKWLKMTFYFGQLL